MKCLADVLMVQVNRLKVCNIKSFLYIRLIVGQTEDGQFNGFF